MMEIDNLWPAADSPTGVALQFAIFSMASGFRDCEHPSSLYVQPAALTVPQGPRSIHEIERGFGLDVSAISPVLQSVPQP